MELLFKVFPLLELMKYIDQQQICIFHCIHHTTIKSVPIDDGNSQSIQDPFGNKRGREGTFMVKPPHPFMPFKTPEDKTPSVSLYHLYNGTCKGRNNNSSILV